MIIKNGMVGYLLFDSATDLNLKLVANPFFDCAFFGNCKKLHFDLEGTELKNSKLITFSNSSINEFLLGINKPSK